MHSTKHEKKPYNYKVAQLNKIMSLQIDDIKPKQSVCVFHFTIF